MHYQTNMKKLLIFLLTIISITLTSCGISNSPSIQPTTDEPSIKITTPQDDKTTTKEDETANMKLTLKINENKFNDYDCRRDACCKWTDVRRRTNR